VLLEATNHFHPTKIHVGANFVLAILDYDGLCRGETRQRPKEVNGDRPPQKVMYTSKPCCKILFYQQVKRSKSGQINDFVGKTPFSSREQLCNIE